MRILVIGAGAREHALAWHLARTGNAVTVCPGNAGIAQQHRCIAPTTSDNAGFLRVAKDVGAQLVVVGPEQPLVDGVVDTLAAAGITTFGPSATAARLEGSKAFMKDVCRAAGVRTADYVVARAPADAEAFLQQRVDGGLGAVVKADGLCAGKGVEVCADAAEARVHVEAFLAGRFGAASRTVVVEDILRGDEVSLFALCDGDSAVMFSGARDHKRLGDGDVGPNTGGMGAVAPLSDHNGLRAYVHAHVVMPILREMRARGAPFRGILFCGLMVNETPKGLDVSVLEFNVRFGDPETEALLLGLPIDLAPVLHAVASGAPLSSSLVLASQRHSAVVVVAAAGYPHAPEAGGVITGIQRANSEPGARVFCAGVASRGDALVASGGRVLVVGGSGDNFSDAIATAYRALGHIMLPGMQARTDIGSSVTAHAPDVPVRSFISQGR